MLLSACSAGQAYADAAVAHLLCDHYAYPSFGPESGIAMGAASLAVTRCEWTFCPLS
jgi:hypothetical protein